MNKYGGTPGCPVICEQRKESKACWVKEASAAWQLAVSGFLLPILTTHSMSVAGEDSQGTRRKKNGFPGETICYMSPSYQFFLLPRFPLVEESSPGPLIVGRALHQLPFLVASTTPDAVRNAPFIYKGGTSPRGLAYIAM